MLDLVSEIYSIWGAHGVVALAYYLPSHEDAKMASVLNSYLLGLTSFSNIHIFCEISSVLLF